MTLDTIQAVQSAAVATADHWHGPGVWWPIIPLLWLVVIGTVITFFAVNGRRRMRAWNTTGQRAGESRLAERYASGEIDDDEYARRLAVLRRTDNG
jgi:putative membrane protein